METRSTPVTGTGNFGVVAEGGEYGESIVTWTEQASDYKPCRYARSRLLFRGQHDRKQPFLVSGIEVRLTANSFKPVPNRRARGDGVCKFSKSLPWLKKQQSDPVVGRSATA